MPVRDKANEQHWRRPVHRRLRPVGGLPGAYFAWSAILRDPGRVQGSRIEVAQKLGILYAQAKYDLKHNTKHVNLFR